MSIDEPAELFQPKLLSSTIHLSADETASVRCSERNSTRAILYVLIASDGKKLLLFINFKERPSGKTEQVLKKNFMRTRMGAVGQKN